MSTFTVSYTYTHTVTHVTTKMLLLVKEIIRESGLDPAKFAADWDTYERAVATWLASRHLQRVTLEVFNPKTNALVTRWDLDVVYATVGGGSLWVDTDAIRYSIAKAGTAPATCRYEVKLTAAPGHSAVAGWSACEFRATSGLQRYSVGSTVGGDGITAEAAFWRKA